MRKKSWIGKGRRLEPKKKRQKPNPGILEKPGDEEKEEVRGRVGTKVWHRR